MVRRQVEAFVSRHEPDPVTAGIRRKRNVPTREAIVEYYDRKHAEYLGKYLVAGRAHAHVGHYDPDRQPELFRDDWIRPSLGAEHLKWLMHSGQENTGEMLVEFIRPWLREPRVLDCGAGLGGTALLLASRYRFSTDALTLSPAQRKTIDAQAREQGLSGLVTAIEGDAFDPLWWDDVPYDLIVGIDAFCQMGSPNKLFQVLARLQRPASVLAISDHFAQDCGSRIASYYNDYWVSEITTIDTTISALFAAGYRLRRLRDTSEMQIPYWELSAAYSELPQDDRTSERRLETKAFHQAMAAAYRNGEMRYYQIVATSTGDHRGRERKGRRREQPQR
jgi:cyclopropane fatty-acyl-phospholipid synthase-like methyltransferase